MTRLTTCVVVCAYTLDRWDDLVAAVHSAVAQDPAPDEVLLVVDHNVDLLQRAEAELAGLGGLRIVPNVRKQGLSGARNTAVEQSAADVLVFLDDDAAAAPGWLSALISHYADPLVVAVGGVATPRWPAERPGRPALLPAGPAGGAAAIGRGELDWVVGCTDTGQPTTASEVRNVMGCNMSFRRSVFGVVGGFSEDLGRVGTVPLGCEETELCLRAGLAVPGSRIVFEPRAQVSHHVTAGRLTWRYLLRRCYAEGVSKAAVSRMTQNPVALATERAYVRSVLPRGVRRELSSALTKGRGRDGLAGAAAIVLALAWTVLGYGYSVLMQQRHPVDVEHPAIQLQPGTEPAAPVVAVRSGSGR